MEEWKSKGLELSTIDRYQGRDKPAIVISFVRSNTSGNSGRLLEDFRRLNVAVSRAKRKLVMIGSFTTLNKGSDVLRPVLQNMRRRNQIVKLPEDALQRYNMT
jgi:DNA replication ATP-dependent helicase Dna2